MFIDRDATSQDSRSNRNARHFDSSGLGSGDDDGSMNISRLRREDKDRDNSSEVSTGSGSDRVNFEDFERVLKRLYSQYTFEFAAKESGVDAKTIEEIAKVVAIAGTKLSSHNWRSVTSGVSHGWSAARALFMLNALLGAVATEGGVFPNAWNKFVPKPIHTPPHPKMWNEKTWPREFPLSMHEMSFLLPHLLKEEIGRASCRERV